MPDVCVCGGAVMTAAAYVTVDPEAPIRYAELDIRSELARSFTEYPQVWRSPEEGAMVLREELDELWDEVRGNRVGLARLEAVQVAAMATRFVADLCERSGPAKLRCQAAMSEVRSVRPFVGPRGRELSSSHEGFGFLEREFDVLWAAVTTGADARAAASRVAAAAVRFIAEITPAARPAARAGVGRR